MTRPLYFFLIFLIAAFAFTACSNEDATNVEDINKQTVIVFMPWSGDDSHVGLYNIFKQNLDSIEGAIKKSKGLSGRLVVFLSTSSSQASLYEVTYKSGQIIHTPIKTYSGNTHTTVSGITEILNDVKVNAYALNYAMMVGCHGSGWTYKNDWEHYPYNAKRNVILPEDANGSFAKATSLAKQIPNAYPTTRFFGSVSDMNYAIDISDLATGIQNAGLKMQFIMFDDCYMANVETAYELRQVTNFLIGSTSEVMAIGVPYQTMWSSLATSTPSYEKAVKAFNTYYKSYAYPFGALSAIDCREVEGLATIMKEINRRYEFPDSLRDSLQVLDGFDTPIFYDMGDYASKLCQNKNMLSDFQSQLKKVVKSTETTDSLYSYIFGYPRYIKVGTYSGLTISDPSKNVVAIRGKEKTGWWKATH